MILSPKTEQITSAEGECTPQALPVIMVTALGLESQIAMCLEEGAADHIVKPFSSMVVWARVRAALRSHTVGTDGVGGAKRGKVIGLIGGKAGAGVSTIAINLATVLAQRQSVLLVELRSACGSMAVQLGLGEGNGESSFLADPEQAFSCKALQRQIVRLPCGFDVLPAPVQGEWTPDLPMSTIGRLIEILPTMADVCLFDLPSWPAQSTPVVLNRCNRILVVTEPDHVSLAATSTLLKRMQHWKVAGCAVQAVLMKHAPSSVSINLEDMRSKLSCTIGGFLPPDPDGCAIAMRAGRPLVSLHPECLFASQIEDIAESLMRDGVQPALSA